VIVLVVPQMPPRRVPCQAMNTSGVRYRSRFGGLWVDREDADEVLDAKLERRAVTEDDAERLRTFMASGYVVLEQAVPTEVVDRFERELARAFTLGDKRLIIQGPGDSTGTLLQAGTSTVRKRVVDAYAFYEPAREALFAAPIVRFLTLIFEDAPLLFQSLSFDRGSQQGMHQDTAYVVTSSPLELAASWIALEDIQPGTGELMYYEGSHRLPEYYFSGEHKSWSPERDGEDQHSEMLRGLDENAARLGMPRKTFLAKKGDALIWAADLAHGGSPVQDDSKTRKSLVGHYCPNRIDPHYFKWASHRRTKLAYDRGFYSTSYYQLGDPSPAPPAAAGNGPTPRQRARKRSGGLLRRMLGRG
jgi:ectoine hydroxylase-related dioxygenase (phytanoyl-CoA dioxygenase family)